MQIDTNVYHDRLAYDYPYRDTLSESEKSLYWTATKDAEDALARIAKVQERRKGEDGEIYSVLLFDEFRIIDDAITQLDEATTILHLIERAAEWTNRQEERRKTTLSDLLESHDQITHLGKGTDE